MNIDRKVFHPVRNERLRELWEDFGIKTYSLTHLSKKNDAILREDLFGKELYEIVDGKRELTEKNAEKLFRLVPQFRANGIRIEWLLGYDDYKTVTDIAYRDKLVGIYTDTTNTARDKFLGLNLFLEHYGYRIIDKGDVLFRATAAKVKTLDKDSEEYQAALAEMHSLLSIQYQLEKDGKVIKFFDSDILNTIYDTFAEMISMVFGRL